MHLLVLIVAAVVGLDQVTKYLVSNSMEIGQSIAVIRTFYISPIIASRGLHSGCSVPHPLFNYCHGSGDRFIIYYYRTLPRFFTAAFGLALQLGGALGNLIDRSGARMSPTLLM